MSAQPISWVSCASLYAVPTAELGALKADLPQLKAAVEVLPD